MVFFNIWTGFIIKYMNLTNKFRFMCQCQHDIPRICEWQQLRERSVTQLSITKKSDILQKKAGVC